MCLTKITLLLLTDFANRVSLEVKYLLTKQLILVVFAYSLRPFFSYLGFVCSPHRQPVMVVHELEPAPQLAPGHPPEEDLHGPGTGLGDPVVHKEVAQGAAWLLGTIVVPFDFKTKFRPSFIWNV